MHDSRRVTRDFAESGQLTDAALASSYSRKAEWLRDPVEQGTPMTAVMYIRSVEYCNRNIVFFFGSFELRGGREPHGGASPAPGPAFRRRGGYEALAAANCR